MRTELIDVVAHHDSVVKASDYFSATMNRLKNERQVSVDDQEKTDADALEERDRVTAERENEAMRKLAVEAKMDELRLEVANIDADRDEALSEKYDRGRRDV